MKSILTIDVESWIHFVDAMGGFRTEPHTLSREARDNGYLCSALERILTLLEDSGNLATFFVLGELFEWIPDILEKIRSKGHEIGYHGHNHCLINTPDTLESQLVLSKDFIDRFQPLGFRAPLLDFTPAAMGLLKRSGFIYSSSSYGPFAGNTVINGIREIPVSTLPWKSGRIKPQKLPRPLCLSILAREMPFGGGMSLGVLGQASAFFIRKSNRRHQPAVVMLHPWQIFPPEELTQMRFKLKILFQHLPYLPYAFSRDVSLRRLIENTEFTSFQAALDLHPENEKAKHHTPEADNYAGLIRV